jgi:hypothetical protein
MRESKRDKKKGKLKDKRDKKFNFKLSIGISKRNR